MLLNVPRDGRRGAYRRDDSRRSGDALELSRREAARRGGENADYLLQHSADIDIDRYRQQGNYSFQYCKNVVIRNAVIDSKDAFWETETLPSTTPN